jgi:hypothetical protein
MDDMRGAGFRQLLLGDGLGAALDGHAFLDQRLEHLAAFLLRLGEGAQAGQPDLLRRFLDGAGKLRRRTAAVAFAVIAGLLQFLDHGLSPGVGRGTRRPNAHCIAPAGAV